MSYNGSGVFNINTAGQPVVTGTVISSTAFNALTADLATGLTTALTKDGQTTPTANIPMGGFKITGIAAATTTGDALSYGRAATVTSISASSVTDSGLTSGRVTYASTSGLLADSASLRFDGTSLGVGGAPTVNAGQTSVTVNGTSNARLDMQIGGTNTAGLVVSSSAAYLQTLTAIPLIFYTNSAEVARFDSSGNVGIGYTSPQARLDVRAANIAVGVTALATAQGQSFVGTTTGWGQDIGGTLALGGAQNSGVLTQTFASISGRRESSLGYIYTGYMQFAVSDGANMVESMRIDSSGNLLVGTTSAAGSRMVVNGATGGTAVLSTINSTGSGNQFGMSSSLGSTANNTSSAHFQGSTTSVGNWYLYGNGTNGFTSDRRLKKNIETTRDGYLEDICKLRVVKYNWKIDVDGTDKELGLIAQEVEQVFPKLVQDDLNRVSPDDETIYKTLKSSVIPFMLLKAIQELNARLTALESK